MYGKQDDKNACLKFIMALYIYLYKIESCMALQDMDFINHPHFPEYDKRVGEYFHEREDHGHVLKRFTHSLRDGNIPGIDLRKSVKALKYPSTGLTKQALTGERKQNVPDCEKVWCKGVVEFLHVHGYNAEKWVASVIRNRYIAVDGRGVCDASRSQYCQEMLDWMLSDWIPGYRNSKSKCDFGSVDVSRRIITNRVHGLARESVIALLASLTSLQMRKHEHRAKGMTLEYPRSGTSGDVESFISVLHKMLGDVFDMKSFLDSYPKILNEFFKRIKPVFPFYFWTGEKTRFTEAAWHSFNQPSSDGVERFDRMKVSKRADPGVFVADRA